jgi:inositol phosphorylceramide mannosyltransferase catalytic subunit
LEPAAAQPRRHRFDLVTGGGSTSEQVGTLRPRHNAARVSLSVCLITADPPARVAAILDPLRPYADEVVIAVDSRAGNDRLAGLASLADQAFKIEFVTLERHVAWLCAQCSGDWILRLDGDEVPSVAFVRRLPEMLASRRVQQYWISRAWLYPDAEQILAGVPWSEDFVNRLTRNDGTLRMSGRHHSHAEPVTPCEYIAEPIYHLDLLTNDYRGRRDKAVRYEVARPHLLAPGGGRINEAFYLPELRETLEQRPVPEEDRAMIARALEAAPVPGVAARTANVPTVSLAETDRLWEGRDIGETAYRAKIERFVPATSFTPAERRRIFIHVTNEGTERWPDSLDAEPAIRLSYHWLDQTGSTRAREGPRTAFSRVVNPGERILAPLHVDAPVDAGEYLLAVDIVHEGERWFGCDCQIPIRVEHPPSLHPDSGRLRETSPARGRRPRKISIPRTIHRVWLGAQPMPEEYRDFGETFARQHPDWELRLWTENDLPVLGIGEDERVRSRSHSEMSDLARYEILRRFGGVYVDADVECLRPLAPLLRGVDAFAALEQPGRVGTAVLGSVAGHPAFARAAEQARKTLGLGENSADATGPYFLSLILEREPDVTIFGAHLFYPYRWDEPERRHDDFPDAYAVHHWAHSWRTDG